MGMGKKIKKKIKIFVASSIYGFEDQLTQICSTLNTFGYEVWNSHIRTVPVHPGLSNQENCLKAVEDCGGTSIMDDIRIIDLYNDTIKNDVSPDERVGHWVDEYFEITDILQCVKTQFVDINRVQRIINEMK